MQDKVDVGKISVTKQMLALRNLEATDARTIKDRQDSDLWYAVYYHNGRFVTLGNRNGNAVTKHEFPTLVKMHRAFKERGYDFHAAGKDDVGMKGFYI